MKNMKLALLAMGLMTNVFSMGFDDQVTTEVRKKFYKVWPAFSTLILNQEGYDKPYNQMSPSDQMSVQVMCCVEFACLTILTPLAIGTLVIDTAVKTPYKLLKNCVERQDADDVFKEKIHQGLYAADEIKAFYKQRKFEHDLFDAEGF